MLQSEKSHMTPNRMRDFRAYMNTINTSPKKQHHDSLESPGTTMWSHGAPKTSSVPHVIMRAVCHPGWVA